MDAFDSDVLIYAAAVDHPFREWVRALFPIGEARRGGPAYAGIGSLLLVPELLTKPHRMAIPDELRALASLRRRLQLRPVDPATQTSLSRLGQSTASAPPTQSISQRRSTRAPIDSSQALGKALSTSIDEVAIAYPVDSTTEASQLASLGT